MNRWGMCISFGFLLLFISACAPHSGSVHEFRELPVKKQVRYFNRLSPNSRMDLLVEIMRGGGEFTIAGIDQLKFFPDGVFVYDQLVDQGYKGGGNFKGDPVHFFKGHWNYEHGTISLENDPRGLQILSEGYTWVSAEAEVFQDKKFLLNMKLSTKKSPDAGEESLFLEDHLNSPAIRSYTDKMKQTNQ